MVDALFLVCDVIVIAILYGANLVDVITVQRTKETQDSFKTFHMLSAMTRSLSINALRGVAGSTPQHQHKGVYLQGLTKVQHQRK